MALLILTVCLALAATVTGSGYGYDRLYRYRYRGYLYSGFTGLKPQHSGLAFDSDVLIHRQGNYYIFQLENVRYDKFNSKVEDFDHSQFNYRHLPSLTEHLTKPVRVFFKDSEIKYYEVSPDDVIWSLNVKRGILSLFNLNFESRPHDLYQHGDHYRNYHSRYYRLYEDGVGGECETSYIVNVHPYHETPHHNNVFNITKKRDYHKCIRQPYREYFGRYGDECVHCEDEKTHPFHAPSSSYHYNIRGSRQNYVIEKVVSDGEITYSPFTSRGQTIYVYINRTLELVDESKDTHSVKVNEGSLIRYYSLAYRYENRGSERTVADLKKPHYLYDVYGYQVPVEEVGRLLHELTIHRTEGKNEKEESYEQSPGRFVELVRAVSTLGYDSINETYKRYVERRGDVPVEKSYRETIESLFVNTLAMTGTNPSFAYAKYLIENRKVGRELIKHYLQAAPVHIKEPTKTLLDEAYRLCEHPTIRQDHELRTAAYLGFSGLVYETCVARSKKKIHSEYKNDCTPESASRYFNYLVPNHRYENDEEQVLYISTAGNFGLREAIDYVRHYIINRDRYPLYFRISAVWALRRVAKSYPEEVLKLVAPVYFDETEDHEVRIAAFTLILKIGPPSYFLETVANSLYHESSDQVLSYVYSTFYYLANSTHPCYRRIAEQARSCLDQLSSLNYEFHPSLDHSFNFFTSGYEEEYDYGGLTHFSYIASNSTYIPRSVYVDVGDYYRGESYRVALGYKGYGLDKYFDRLFGPKGPYRDSSIFENFGSRSPRDVNTVQKELKELKDKVEIKTREYEPVYGDLFTMLQGTQISLFHFNETLFEYLLNLEHQNSRHEEATHRYQMDRYVLGVDRLYVVPTDLGFALLFDEKQPLHLHYEQRELRINCNKEKGRILPTRIEAKLDGHLSYDHETYLTLGVVVPYAHTTYGVGIRRHSRFSLPLNLEGSLDLAKVEFDFKYVPVTPHNLYLLEFEPFTYVDSYENHQSIHDEDGYTPLYDRKHLEHFEREYFQDYLGVGLKVEAHYPELWNDYGSWYEFLTNTDYRQKYYYFIANPHFRPYHLSINITSPHEHKTEKIEGEVKYVYHGLNDETYKPEHLNEGLEDYGVTGSDRKWKTHVITGDIYARGQKERHMKTELTYSYTYDHLYHKYNIYYDRTPFHTSENKHFKVCFSGIWSYPHYDYNKFYNLETLELDHTVKTRHNLYFGADCKSDKKVTIAGSVQKTEEQKKYEARRDEPVKYERFNEYAYYYQKCKQARENGFHYNSYCRYYLYLVSQLNDYGFDITYGNLPESYRNISYKIASCIKHLYHFHVDSDVYAVNNDNQIRVEANVSLHDSIADVRIYKPRENTFYNKIHLHYFRPISTFPSLDYSYPQEYFSLYEYHYCLVQRDHVNTFDNLTYTRRTTDCYEILARDCSEKEEFVVLGKKITHNRYEKAVRVLFGKYKVEMLPVSEESGIIVRVNGKRVTVVENEPYYHYVTEGEHQRLLFFVSYNGLYYELHSHPYGLTVVYTGKVIYIQLSPYHRGKLCGLCGDYNGDRHDELRGPEDCVYHNTTAFAYSYAVPEDGCTVPQHENICAQKHAQRCVEERNRYVSIGSDRNRKICFTTVPLPRCSHGCVPTKTVTRKLAFHCLPAREGFTKHLQRESEFRQLNEIRRKSEDYEAEVEYPEDCHVSEN